MNTVKAKNAESAPVLSKRRKGTGLREFWSQFSKNKAAVVSLIIIILLILASVCAPLLTPYDYEATDLINKMKPPSSEHPFGTDNYGRDILTRVLYGGRMSLLISLVAVVMSMIVGALLGAIAGYYGDRVDSVIMRILDMFMSIPGLLLSVSVSIVLGTGIVETAAAIAIGSVPPLARVIRAQVLTIRGQEYIEASRAVGASNFRIILSHVIPNSLAPLIVQATMRIGSTVSLISSLSFLGAGVQPPTPEWGSMLSEGRTYILSSWPMVVFPGIAISLTMLAFNIFGDGVRDALDPKLRR
ncbi:MAG: ABC transporter permease [Oscillospiraceae bacterium]|jgi:peptide/nickel transport system permease protein